MYRDKTGLEAVYVILYCNYMHIIINRTCTKVNLCNGI